ncbi:MAG: sporulation protein [Desulfamplus sp.]|nr:sporulation protein [Desulfamplus sp.]
MSFFNKMLSKMGVGSTTVETELFNDIFIPGEPIKGKVTIRGGSVEQSIDSIYFKIKSTYEDEIEIKSGEDEDEINITRTALILDDKVSEPFVINPDQVIKFDLDFKLPIFTPVTAGKTKTWVETGLDIKMALDPTDKDYINVKPHPLMQSVFNSAMELGLQMYKVVCEPAPRNMNMMVPFVQEFALKPVRGDFKRRLEEIELIFRPMSNGFMVFMEIDLNARGLSGRFAKMMGTDEKMVRFPVNYDNLNTISMTLNDLIDKHC